MVWNPLSYPSVLSRDKNPLAAFGEDSLINYIEGKNVQTWGTGRPERSEGTPFSLGVKEADLVSEVKGGAGACLPSLLRQQNSRLPSPPSEPRFQPVFFESLYTQATAISTQRTGSLPVSPALWLHPSQGSELKYSPFLPSDHGKWVSSSRGVGKLGLQSSGLSEVEVSGLQHRSTSGPESISASRVSTQTPRAWTHGP